MFLGKQLFSPPIREPGFPSFLALFFYGMLGLRTISEITSFKATFSYIAVGLEK